MGKLTDIELRKWIKVGAPVVKSDGGGLCFTMSAKQAIERAGSWIVRYRFDGKGRELTLGRLERIKKGDLPREGFGSRDIQRACWSGLADPKRVAEGLALPVELGHLEAWQEPTRGRLKTLYVVNPKTAPARH